MQVIQPGDLATEIDAIATPYPSRLSILMGANTVGQQSSTIYGYVREGIAKIEHHQLVFEAKQRTFFSLSGEFSIETDGNVVLIERIGFVGLCCFGAIEKKGRLSYMDGSTTSMLVPPARFGDPTLNYIHFPNGVDQRFHSHPTIRLGVVVSGTGKLVTGNGSGRERGVVVSKGCVVFIDAHERHAFRTLDEGHELELISFHPDSNWGPTDESHPVVDRTHITTGNRV